MKSLWFAHCCKNESCLWKFSQGKEWFGLNCSNLSCYLSLQRPKLSSKDEIDFLLSNLKLSKAKWWQNLLNLATMFLYYSREEHMIPNKEKRFIKQYFWEEMPLCKLLKIPNNTHCTLLQFTFVLGCVHQIKIFQHKLLISFCKMFIDYLIN